ncbi:MAG: T9SS type A sorting domain-containing protein [Chitinophagales bacterium]|nr:T9SS type A sorting domain-containing protein [Chitinophagales bacterium]
MKTLVLSYILFIPFISEAQLRIELGNEIVACNFYQEPTSGVNIRKFNSKLGDSLKIFGGVPPYSYSWRNDTLPDYGYFLYMKDVLDDSTIANPSLDITKYYNTEIKFVLTVTDALGAIAMDTVLIKKYQRPYSRYQPFGSIEEIGKIISFKFEGVSHWRYSVDFIPKEMIISQNSQNKSAIIKVLPGPNSVYVAILDENFCVDTLPFVNIFGNKSSALINPVAEEEEEEEIFLNKSNPIEAQTNWTFVDKSKDFLVLISDVSGRRVLEKKYSGFIPISDLLSEKGIYFLTILDDKRTLKLHQRIMKN